MPGKEIPFLRIVIPLSSGIIAGHYLRPGPSFFIICVILAVITFSISLFFNKGETNYLYGPPFTLSLFICGLLLFRNEINTLSDLKQEEGEFLCSISDFPEEKESSYMLIAKLLALDTDSGKLPLSGSIVIYMKKEEPNRNFLPGDFIKIRCTPEPIINRGNPYEFDYRFYMENHGTKYFSYCSPVNIIRHYEPDHRKLMHIALIIRKKIIGTYEQLGITGDKLALVAAITLGYKNLLDPGQKQLFINAGVMHIMAVSGLHVVILSVFIFKLLFFMKRRFETLRIILAVIILWGFAFITGLTPSVVRATLMFSFLQAGKLMKRNVNSVNSVLASAAVLMVAEPSVIFDAGFLLSYSSVIFIVCFYRDTYLKLRFRTWAADKLWQSAAITVIAQIGTLPLTISLFNRFPTWFILTNIIIVPLSSFLVIVGCVVPLISPLKFVSLPLASLLKYLTGLTEGLTEKATMLPYATIDNIGMTSTEALLLSFTLFLFLWFFKDNKSIPIKFLTGIFIAFILTGTVYDITSKVTSELCVYNIKGQGTVGIRTGKILTCYWKEPEIPNEILRHCAVKRLKLNVVSSDKEIRILEAGKSKILMCDFPDTGLIDKTKPDYVILKGSGQWSGKKISSDHPIKAVVITSRKSSDYFLPANNIKCNIDSIHCVKKSGAYRHRL